MVSHIFQRNHKTLGRRLTKYRRNAESATTNTKHAYPTSSKKQTNWDALAKAAAAEDDLPADSKDPNAGGDAALNKLFQSIYSGGTDEQKKAMIKSYQESGGTALSTDWNEVQKVRLVFRARTAADHWRTGNCQDSAA